MSLPQATAAKQGDAGRAVERLRAVLVDGNEFLRAGLRVALGALGIAIVGEAIDADQAIALVAQLSPAVVIMGQPAERGCGIEATHRLAAAAPATPVMLLATSTEREDVTAAIRAGARG